MITSPVKIANVFNSHFIDKVESLSNRINNDYLGLPTQRQSMFLKPISTDDVIRIIKSLKNKNSTGHDDISTKAVKFVSE